MDLEDIILSEVTQSQKNTHDMHSLISVSEYPRYNFQNAWNSRRRKTKVWILWSFLDRENMEGVTETKCEAETEGMTIQRLVYLGIHPIYSHQTQTQLWMPTSACWQKPVIAVSWEALPVPDKYRGGCSQPNIALSVGSSIKDLEKGLKELKGFASP